MTEYDDGTFPFHGRLAVRSSNDRTIEPRAILEIRISTICDKGMVEFCVSVVVLVHEASIEADLTATTPCWTQEGFYKGVLEGIVVVDQRHRFIFDPYELGSGRFRRKEETEFVGRRWSRREIFEFLAKAFVKRPVRLLALQAAVVC